MATIPTIDEQTAESSDVLRYGPYGNALSVRDTLTISLGHKKIQKFYWLTVVRNKNSMKVLSGPTIG